MAKLNWSNASNWRKSVNGSVNRNGHARGTGTPTQRNNQIISFGKYKNYRIADLPLDYLMWLCAKLTDHPQHQYWMNEYTRRAQ